MNRITVALSFATTVAGQDTFGPCYLYDNYCMENPDPTGKLRGEKYPFDGNDPRTVPWLHSTGCLLHAPECTTNGYGLNCEDPNASGDLLYKRTHKFDAAGSADALTWIQSLPTRNNLCVTVQGTAGSPNGNATILSNVGNITFATGCRKNACTSGPDSRPCQNGGSAAGTAGSCTCDCPSSFAGDWCEKKASCPPSSLDVGEALDCVYTVKADVLNMHYKDNSEEKTLFLCFENLKDNGYVAAGPGEGMAKGTRAVVSAEGHDQNKVFDITSVGEPTEFFLNFGHTKLRSLVQDEKRINCFQMPYSRLDPDENSISSTNIAWAVGAGEAFNEHHQHRGVFQFNFRSGDAEFLADVPVLIIGHAVLMMIAFLLLYPAGALVAVFAGPHFQKGATYFNAHRVLMMLAILVSIAGVALALTYSKVDTPHGGLGLAVMVLCVLQPINAFFRPKKEHHRRRMWELLHKGLGRVGVVLGLATCTVGAFIFNDRYGYSGVIVTVLVILVVVVISWLVLLCQQPKSQEKKEYRPSSAE